MATRIMEVLTSCQCRYVHIGGGEPMLRPDKLATVLQVAEQAGIGIDYVETNSSWYRDHTSTRQILLQLRRHGLHTLLISISPFHNEYIPLAKIQAVMEVAREKGFQLFPWVLDFVPDISRLDPHFPHDLAEYESVFGTDYLKKILHRYWIHLGGRALDTFRPHLAKQGMDEILNAHPEGCHRELSDTSHFHIDLYGNYILGLCVGLSISMDDLGMPISSETYPIVNVLYHEGIRGLYEMARRQINYQPGRDKYINKCDLCTEIRTHLYQQVSKAYRELSPEEFYATPRT